MRARATVMATRRAAEDDAEADDVEADNAATADGKYAESVDGCADDAKDELDANKEEAEQGTEEEADKLASS